MPTKNNTFRTAVLYVHGKGENADEANHYQSLFPNAFVVGLDYQTNTPWETGAEVRKAVAKLKETYDRILLIANSIGAFYSMNTEISDKIDHAFFISPMVDMENMISNLMRWANVSEADLQREKRISTDFGEDLSWEYLCYVREHPLNWTVPTDILYGSEDHLTSREIMNDFAQKTHSTLTVMPGGEHWFHTDEQIKFLDSWIKNKF